MKIIQIKKSSETCSEAGWYAYDFFLDGPLEEGDILKFKALGSFLYLSMLKAPFFKVEGDYFLVKGVKGDGRFRVAAHGDHLDIIDRVKSLS